MNDGAHAAGAQDILHVEAGRGGHLADIRGAFGNVIDALEVILHAGFPGDSQRMKHGIGAAAHRHIDRKGIVDGVTVHDVARQGTVRLRHLHGAARGLLPELLAFLGSSQQGTVAGKGQADYLAQAIHGIGRKHAGTGTGAGAGAAFQGMEFLRIDFACLEAGDGLKHAVQVQYGAVLRHAGGHRAAAAENSGNIAAQGAHDHAGNNLVAIRNADHGVKRVGAQHRLHAVRDQLTAGQGKLHAAVAHGNAVTNAGQVELHGSSSGLAHFLLDEGGYLVQVDMARNHLIKGIANGNERTA